MTDEVLWRFKLISGYIKHACVHRSCFGRTDRSRSNPTRTSVWSSRSKHSIPSIGLSPVWI